MALNDPANRRVCRNCGKQFFAWPCRPQPNCSLKCGAASRPPKRAAKGLNGPGMDLQKRLLFWAIEVHALHVPNLTPMSFDALAPLHWLRSANLMSQNRNNPQSISTRTDTMLRIM